MKNKNKLAMDGMLGIVFSVAVSFNAYAEEIIEPVVSGMKLELGNYVQQVEVRSKSFGPGFCAVEFNIGRDEVRILAPPLVWSDWVKADTAYLSPANVKVEENVVCDVGVLSEVKFHK